MKRRNSKNLTFNDMMTYADFREANSEAKRLAALTTNAAVKYYLLTYANKVWSDFSEWLDEDIEDGNM
jgi:uncharacterized membrane-anchored protein YjiN (DUF445 family)